MWVLPSRCVSTDTDAPSPSLCNYPQTPGDRWNELPGNRMHLVQWHPPERLDCNVFKQWEEAMRWRRQRIARERTRHGHGGEQDKGEMNNKKINGESLISPLSAGDTAAALNSMQLTLRFGCLKANYRHHIQQQMKIWQRTLAVYAFTHQIDCLSTTGVSNTHPEGWIQPMEESNLAPLKGKKMLFWLLAWICYP